MAIEGKVALVTGGAMGIGYAIAKRLAADGGAVSLVDINEEAVKKAAEDLAATGAKVTSYVADVSDRDAVFAAVAHTVKELGRLDVMVNNAGIAPMTPIPEITEADLEKIFRININSVVWGTQAAVEQFRKTGTKGKIINASSIAGHDGFPNLSPYCMTKFAVRSFTQSAAKEFGAEGITVNAYCPGVVETPLWKKLDEDFSDKTGSGEGETFEAFASGAVLGRPEQAEDVANFVSYLASSDSDFMTGQAVLIDGGMVFR